jgi:hypothetical protein
MIESIEGILETLERLLDKFIDTLAAIANITGI